MKLRLFSDLSSKKRNGDRRINIPVSSTQTRNARNQKKGTVVLRKYLHFEKTFLKEHDIFNSTETGCTEL